MCLLLCNSIVFTRDHSFHLPISHLAKQGEKKLTTKLVIKRTKEARCEIAIVAFSVSPFAETLPVSIFIWVPTVFVLGRVVTGSGFWKSRGRDWHSGVGVETKSRCRGRIGMKVGVGIGVGIAKKNLKVEIAAKCYPPPPTEKSCPCL